MTTIKDRSGNGQGVVVDQPLNTIAFSGGDVTVPNNANYLRAAGAGNVIVRVPGSTADITIPAKDGEYIPTQPGTIVRQTGTTVTSLLATR
jgi:hypothetical protein